jgi:GntR family transcriptional regulator
MLGLPKRMDNRMIGQAAPTPRYWQVRRAVEKMIEADGLGVGDRLPTEAELEARFVVSRGTVRRAFDDLEREGVVTRQPGRGTFVAERRMPRPLPELTSFSEHLRSLGLTPGATLVSYRKVLDHADGLDHFPRGTRLARVVRVRTANGEPVGIHTLLVPATLAARIGFTASALRDSPDLSLYAALEAGGHRIDSAREDLTARALTGREGELLNLPPRSPVLEVIRRTFDERGQPLERVRAVYRGDRYDYVVWLRRSSDLGFKEVVDR